MANKQLKRLEAAGWQCDWQCDTNVYIGQVEVERRFTVWGAKGKEKVVVHSDRNEQRRAWEELYLEAKRVDEELRS